MGEDLHFDLVTVGGGFAGLCAALRGAELGLRSAVIEAGENDGYPCSSRWAGGIFHVSYHDVKLSPAELLAAIDRADGRTRPIPSLLRRLPGTRRAPSIGWRARAPSSPGAAGSTGTVSRSNRRVRRLAGQDWRGRGPDRLLGELQPPVEMRHGRMFLCNSCRPVCRSKAAVASAFRHASTAAESISAPRLW